MYDLIIIGGGPAGTAAAVYAARKRLHTLFITESWGGQSTESMDIQNWIGTPSITGTQLAKDLEEHVRTYANDCVEILSPARATKVEKLEEGVTVTTGDGSTYTAKALLIATGSHRRKLDIPGAAEFENKGVTYCASCDGPMFTDQPVVVVGGGNAGFESAAQLQAYTDHVTLLQRSDHYKADPITVERVLAHDNVTGLTNAAPVRIVGENFVTGVVYNDAKGDEVIVEANGVFVEIGLVPNTELVGDLLEKDTVGRLVIDPWNQKTSEPMIWAAGDCTNILYHQNNISAGHAVTALEDIYLTLRTK
jgi:alkyl hydroperoxide reductase subunit F